MAGRQARHRSLCAYLLRFALEPRCGSWRPVVSAPIAPALLGLSADYGLYSLLTQLLPHTRDRPCADYECKEGGQGDKPYQNYRSGKPRAASKVRTPHDEGVDPDVECLQREVQLCHADTLLVWANVPRGENAQNDEDTQHVEYLHVVEYVQVVEGARHAEQLPVDEGVRENKLPHACCRPRPGRG